MARLTATFRIPPEVDRTLAQLGQPGLNRTRRQFLLTAGFRVQRNAAQKQIIRGGRRPPHPSRLTSRTGTLRRSIRLNRTGLPNYVEIGTDLAYGAVHEFGGTVAVPAHTRRSVLGNRYRVRGYTARYPKRAFIEPAIDEESQGFEALLLSTWRGNVYSA